MFRSPCRSLAVLVLAGLAQLPSLGAAMAQPQRQQIVTPGYMPDPGVANRTIRGPRLEPGAVLCRSLEALDQRQALVARATADGADEPALPAGCALVAHRIAVEVLERRGMGRTRVKTQARHPEEGWTDAWLPQR